MPLHIGKIWKHSEGRWNRRGEYACLYTAVTRDGALAELGKARLQYGNIIGPRDLVSIDIEQLEPILDLTDSGVYRATALSAGELRNDDLMVRDGDAAYEHCRRLAGQARLEQFTGLLAPSAAAPGQKNLIIYFDVVAPKHVRVDDGPDRERV